MTVFVQSIVEAIHSQSVSLDGPYSDFPKIVAQALRKWAPGAAVAELGLELDHDILKSRFADMRSAMLGLVQNQKQVLEAIDLTQRLKLYEVLEGMVSCMNQRKNRIAILCCRTLMEEVAQFSVHLGRFEAAIASMTQTPPSAFREARLERLEKTAFDKYKEISAGITAVRHATALWWNSRRVQMADFYSLKDQELERSDWSFQPSILSAIDRWKIASKRHGEVSARRFYDRLCEVTHPNSGANSVYVVRTSHETGLNIMHISNDAHAPDLLHYVLDFVCRPTMAAVSVADEHLARLHKLTAVVGDYLAKMRASP